MKRIGEIQSIENGKIRVVFCHMEHCGSCHACEGGQSQAELELKLPDIACSVGDLAEVEMPTGNVIKASLLVYTFPMLAFLGGLALGTLLFPDQTLITALLGIVCLLLVVYLVHLGEKKRSASAAWQPQLTRIIPRELSDIPGMQRRNAG